MKTLDSLTDKTGKPLSQNTLYKDSSKEDDLLNTCWIEVYAEGKLVFMYNDGRTHPLPLISAQPFAQNLQPLSEEAQQHYVSIREGAFSFLRTKINKPNQSAQEPEMEEYVIDPTLGWDDPARYGLRPKTSSKDDIPL